MSLTVKAFLKKPGTGSPDNPQYEIRRFGVDADVSTSFVYLQQKITTVFPSLANRTVELYWRDAENDLIAFSSDDELTEALGFLSDGVFKVYVEEKGETRRETKENTSANSGVLHPHVTCDGCEGPVRGTRYKCQVCPDYDLCMGCKSTGLHSEHQMTAFDTPIFRPFCGGGLPPFGMVPPGPPPCYFPPPPAAGVPPPPPPPQPPMFFPMNAMNRDEMRMQRRAWRRWMKSCGADPCKMWKKEKKEEKKEEKKQEKKKRKAEKKAMREKERAEKGETTQGEASKKINDSSSSSSSSDEGENSPTGDYLHSIGQSVAAMLDPLGIDVDIDVEHKGRTRHCQRGYHGGPWGWHMRGGFGGPGCGRGRGGFFHMGGHPRHPWFYPGHAPTGHPTAPTASTSQGPPPASEPEKMRQCDVDTNSETGELRSGFQTPGVGPTNNPFQQGDDQSSKAATSHVETNGWTFVPGNDEADVTDAAAGIEMLQVSGDGPSQPPSIDVKLIEALEQMMLMGYGDDDGWLTALLVDNNYDIGRTLDAINNRK